MMAERGSKSVDTPPRGVLYSPHLRWISRECGGGDCLERNGREANVRRAKRVRCILVGPSPQGCFFCWTTCAKEVCRGHCGIDEAGSGHRGGDQG